MYPLISQTPTVGADDAHHGFLLVRSLLNCAKPDCIWISSGIQSGGNITHIEFAGRTSPPTISLRQMFHSPGTLVGITSHCHLNDRIRNCSVVHKQYFLYRIRTHSRPLFCKSVAEACSSLLFLLFLTRAKGPGPVIQQLVFRHHRYRFGKRRVVEDTFRLRLRLRLRRRRSRWQWSYR